MPRTWAWRTLAQRHRRTASTAKATIAMLVVMMNHGDATNFGTPGNVQKVAGMSPDAIYNQLFAEIDSDTSMIKRAFNDVHSMKVELQRAVGAFQGRLTSTSTAWCRPATPPPPTRHHHTVTLHSVPFSFGKQLLHTVAPKQAALTTCNPAAHTRQG